MDSKDQPRYNLDADILQCKADIQKALGSAVSAQSAIIQSYPPIPDLPDSLIKTSPEKPEKAAAPEPVATSPPVTVRVAGENPVELPVLSIEEPPKEAADSSAAAQKKPPKARAASRPKVSAKKGKKRPEKPTTQAEPALQDEISALRSRLEEIASQLQLRGNTDKDNENRLASALEDIRKNARTLSSLQTAAGQTQYDQAALAETIEKTKTRLQQLHTDLSAMQDTYNRQTESWAKWREDLTKQISSFQRQQQRTSALEDRLTENSAKLNNINDNFHDCIGQNNIRLADLGTQLSLLNEQLLQSQDIELFISQLKELKNQQDAIALRVEKNASVQSWLETLSNRLQNTQKRLDGLDETGARTQRQIEKIHEKLSDYVNALDRIERKLGETQPVQLNIPPEPAPAVVDVPSSKTKKRHEPASVPQFSLDEQTIARPRRRVSAGREGPAHRLSPDRRDSVRAVVNQYIRPLDAPKETYQPAEKKPVPVAEPWREPVPAQPASLPTDPFAERLLVHIVGRDIARFLSPAQSLLAGRETLRNN